ncbi:MAG: hypothetical protein AAGB13_07535 [Cyanobacteria bacterium P01_F01_bin.33]
MADTAALRANIESIVSPGRQSQGIANAAFPKVATVAVCGQAKNFDEATKLAYHGYLLI